MFATKKILFYWCFFFLFCGQVFSQEREKVTPKPCPGVVINGVCWAECNVDEPGTFAATPLSYGMLYTWNQKKAWPLETQDTWGWSGEHFYEWTVDNDPCPSGWRVPTIEEFQKLLDRSKVTRTYFDIATPEVQPTGFRSIWGWKFTDNYSGNSISLVRAGMILYDGDYTAHAATSGYWTRSLRPNRFYRYYISMSSLSFEISSTASYEAMSVRCVVPDWEASPCDTILKDTAVVICKKDLPYLWGDTIFDIGTESGVYRFQYAGATGCDSIVHLHLNVHQPQEFFFSDAVCCGSHYNNYGFTLSAVSADTVVSDTFQTRWGCDSIRTLSLTVNPLYDTLLYDTVCYGEPYYKYGFQLPQVLNDGVYHLPLVSQAGCDSILSLYLTVLPVFHLTVRDSVCPSERYDKHGFHLSDVRTSGLFRLPLQTVHGCDSVITLELYVYPTYFHPRTEYICYGDTVDFRGRRLYESGIYYDSLRTVHGCDSIYNLDLTVHPVYDIRFSGVLCEGSSYTGYDFDVSEAGVHQHRLKSVHGCDSVVTLTLTEEKKIQGGIGFLLDDCSTHKYRFFLDPPQPLHTWQWEMGDGTVYRSEEGFHRYADSGVYRIQLRTETDSGCENHFSHVQQVPSYLSHVPVHADRQVIDENYPTVRFRTEVPSDMEGVWNFGDGTTAKGDSVIHTFDATSREYYDVTLRVMNADSCITENSLRIEVLFLPKPVNTFSPNGDGVNDIFMADYRIEIIDRNGLRIYAGDNGWDGTCKGRQVPEDTYFFRLYYRTADGERVKTGYVTLVR